jgi:hypothetical protein
MADQQRMMTVTCKGGNTMEISEDIARMSIVWSGIMDSSDDDDTELDCPNTTVATLENVVKFCNQHKVDPLIKIDVKGRKTLEENISQEWYLDFIKEFIGENKDELFAMIGAVNYLDIPSLLSLSVLALCSTINNKTEDEIRAVFNITKPTPRASTDSKEAGIFSNGT